MARPMAARRMTIQRGTFASDSRTASRQVPLIVHLYDLGPARGFVLAGVERLVR